MPRIKEVDLDQAPPEVRKAFEQQIEQSGMVFNPSKVYAHVPSIMFAANHLAEAIGSGPHVDPEILAMVNTRVAQINGCPF